MKAGGFPNNNASICLTALILTLSFLSVPVRAEKRFPLSAGYEPPTRAEYQTVLQGRIVEVGPPPGFLRGTFQPWQHFEFQVDKVLSGDYKDTYLTVALPIIVGTEGVDTRIIGLDSQVFCPGAELIVGVKLNEWGSYITDLANGVIVIDQGEMVSPFEYLGE